MFRLQGAFHGLVDLFARNDLCGAQRFEVIRCLGSTGDACHLMAKVGQNGRCNRPDTACRAGDQNGAFLDAVIFQRHDRKHRGETGRSDSHGLACVQTFGQRNQPVGLDPRLCAYPPQCASPTRQPVKTTLSPGL